MKRWYLVEARQRAGLSQEQVADRVGTTVQYISMVENFRKPNKNGLTIMTAMKFSKAYEMPFETICAEEAKVLQCE